MQREDGSETGTELSSERLYILDPRLAVPSYDRTALGRGIVNIGVGSFHRAHQAMYLDDLCEDGLADWSITGAGVLPGDAAMRSTTSFCNMQCMSRIRSRKFIRWKSSGVEIL